MEQEVPEGLAADFPWTIFSPGSGIFLARLSAAGTLSECFRRTLAHAEAFAGGPISDPCEAFPKEIAYGADKVVKINKLKPCSHCNGKGAVSESDMKTCPTCKGTGVFTRVTHTFLGQMQSSSPCPQCNGEGKTITNPCSVCKGEGVVKQAEEISFSIPKGVEEGMQLTISGKGNAPKRGGVNGNLLVVIEEEPHPELQRDGHDLIYTLFLSFAQAALGEDLEIPTIDGKARIKVESGIQSGRILRLRGKGLPDVNGYGTGDLLVFIQVWTPKKLSRKKRICCLN